jgi:hypothetical protein
MPVIALFIMILFLASTPARAAFVVAHTGFADRGASWVDYNNDGFVDLHDGDTLWKNNNGSSFSSAGALGGVNAVWGDFDNDGFIDIYARIGELKRNAGGSGAFIPVSMPALPMTTTQAATWADHDGDGFIDLYVGGSESPYQPDAIVKNHGGAFFTVTWVQTVDLNPARGITACDFDQDGDTDIFASGYRLENNQLWQNDGSGAFTDVAPLFGADGLHPTQGRYAHTIGSAWGDLDNNGSFDLFVGNFAHPPGVPAGNPTTQPESQFLKNLGPTGNFHFTDMASTAQLAWQESYASPALGDYDNDGDLDLYLSVAITGGSGGIVQHPVLYRNEGSWQFSDVTAAEGLGNQGPTTYQAAWADFDNDGDLDLVSDGSIFENQGNGNHWLKIRLEGNGNTVNRSAIGAQVRIRLGAETLIRQVETGTGEGNQNDLTLHFGLGTHSDPVALEILWPNGRTEGISGVAVDQLFAATAPPTGNQSAVGRPSATNGWSSLAGIAGITVDSAANDQDGLGRLHLADGTGISGPAGEFHSGDLGNVIPPFKMWRSAPGSVATGNRFNAGTVVGAHYAAVEFNEIETLRTLQIWNYNENGSPAWAAQGMKQVTIQYSRSGGPTTEEWNTIYDGPIPYAGQPQIAAFDVPFGDVETKFVVITNDEGTNGSYWVDFHAGVNTDAGLSELRFILPDPPTVFSQSAVNDVSALEFQSEAGVSYRLEFHTNQPPDVVWVPAGTVLSGNGGLMRMFDPTGYSTQKTYRIMPLEGVNAAGNPSAANGWSSLSGIADITVDSAANDGDGMGRLHLADGTGISGPAGELHSGDLGNVIPPFKMWRSASGSVATGNRFNAGTVVGAHYVAVEFNNMEKLRTLQIWNYNENGVPAWAAQGMKEVTIQYSTSGGPTTEEWTTIYDGPIPYAGQPQIAAFNVPFGDVEAKFVVITNDEGTEGSYWVDFHAGVNTDAGLSELRFIRTVDFAPITVEDVATHRFQSETGKSYTLEFSVLLVPDDWTPIGAVLTGNGDIMTMFDRTGASARKAYRIVTSP